MTHHTSRSSRPVRRRLHRLQHLAACACAVLLSACAGGQLAGTGVSRSLDYTNDTRGISPIPASERNLETALAEPYFKVSDKPLPLEGLAFDRQGNLLFVDIFGGRVLHLTPELELTTIFIDKTLTPVGIAIHRDGRIFVVGVGNLAAGRMIALDPDGSNPRTIVPDSAGYVPDDLVFDSTGGIYFSDVKGTSTSPTGGVYYIAPDAKTITPLLSNMAMANGVTLSPDGKALWATEFAAGRLHRVDLNEHGGIAPFGSTVPFHFTGRAPDSMRTDADGNVYVAMFNQARILVFSPNGVPIGQILLPGREQNHFLTVSSMAFLPGSREMLIVAWDEIGGRGAMIFKAQGFAKGATLFSHR
ncbi:SMP-30/gluconolactonase/LRE family protein [Duganella sp. BJB488]|uniref:SMP-30/gluconolactonase/LRE family protein n=1 Tax=unclassified Duganella TaxID=2636909 RepID=UPI000E34DC4B|nr:MULTISPECIES: SMP-30/gluconolactonase/LRE family protein [unclassified Duganella]RFP08380.1 SMP-30/gluconolactonase/LRE family protein [Duganella sp. BJB489]RFP18009.1 SMP-30/gluconolactonase/LRE family protein [Duganella sp. BJB488]RFP37765.1 SMP-30/gluconolactonase/LRE family protein [Duganella sp. BJB480]